MKENKTQNLQDSEKMEKMYHMMMEYETQIHEKNQKRIKTGLRCIFIIPAIFMFLMFTTGSSKIIFLVLWICSLFGLAVYLIYVEYMDHDLQERLRHISGEDNELDSLIAVPDLVENKVMEAMKKVERADIMQFIDGVDNFDLKEHMESIDREAFIEKLEQKFDIEEKKERLGEKRESRKERFEEKRAERRENSNQVKERKRGGDENEERD